jgi:hypothetical protein
MSLLLLVVLSQTVDAGSFHMNVPVRYDTSGYMLRSGTGGITLQSSGDRLVSFRSGNGGAVVAWIDNDGVYHRASTEPPRPPPPPDWEAEHVRRIIAAMPAPLAPLAAWKMLALVNVAWVVPYLVWALGSLYGWRRLAALLLTRPLRRLSKWLDRGPRQREAVLLRFKRDLNRTIEQLESERRP